MSLSFLSQFPPSPTNRANCLGQTIMSVENPHIQAQEILCINLYFNPLVQKLSPGEPSGNPLPFSIDTATFSLPQYLPSD